MNAAFIIRFWLLFLYRKSLGFIPSIKRRKVLRTKNRIILIISKIYKLCCFFSLMSKKGVMAFSPVDLIAGAVIIIGGLAIALGRANLGAVLTGIGLLIEAIRMMVKFGP